MYPQIYLFPRTDGYWWAETFNNEKESEVSRTIYPVSFGGEEVIYSLFRDNPSIPLGTYEAFETEAEWQSSGEPLRALPKGYVESLVKMPEGTGVVTQDVRFAEKVYQVAMYENGEEEGWEEELCYNSFITLYAAQSYAKHVKELEYYNRIYISHVQRLEVIEEKE